MHLNKNEKDLFILFFKKIKVQKAFIICDYLSIKEE